MIVMAGVPVYPLGLGNSASLIVGWLILIAAVLQICGVAYLLWRDRDQNHHPR